MRIFIFIIILCSLVLSAGKATKPYTFTPHTTSSATQVNSNFDSVYVPFNKAIDTMNIAIPRKSTMFRYLKSGDTLIDTMKATRAIIDTVRTQKVVAESLFVGGDIFCTTYVMTNKIVTNQIQMQTTNGAIDSVYTDSIYVDTLFSHGTIDTFKVSETVKIVQRGNHITANFSDISHSMRGSARIHIPLKFLPSNSFMIPVPIGGPCDLCIGFVSIEPTYIELRTETGVAVGPSHGNARLYSCCISWIKN
jgi:hypothetical protein